ncbi:YceD family protein [Effusibacillus pohliae]|uniref:YceD family protein n=1 Tax=Effusibacillus pohliae TaxID=232270 RepID=UPI00035E19E8|nr:DUF177 domain-containing protein [Effusibacillus pohliae]
MLLRWRDVHDKPNGVELYDSLEFPNVLKENRQIISLGPIDVQLHVEAVSDTLTVNGNLKGPITYRCSRCLTDFQDEIAAPFSEQFVRVPPDELDAEDERIPVTGDAIDLDPYLEQEILLALPYTPVCQEACAGLCPVCGINRNEQVCTCKAERIDPRLADLAKLFNPE